MKRLVIFILACFWLGQTAVADIYQITDEKGNKVFTNIEPKDARGKSVKKLEVKETNTSAHDGVDNDTYFEQQRQQRQESEKRQSKQETEQRLARQAVQEAELELEQAKQLQSGDYFNIPGKGMRYKDSYYKRIELAEKKLKNAQQHLRSVQRGE